MKLLTTTCIRCTTFSFSPRCGIVWRGVEPNSMLGYSMAPREFMSRSWHLCLEISNTNHTARMSFVTAHANSRAIWRQVQKYVTFYGMSVAFYWNLLRRFQSRYAMSERTVCRYCSDLCPHESTVEATIYSDIWGSHSGVLLKSQFCIVTPCRRSVSRCFEGSQCLQFQGQAVHDEWRRTTIFWNVWNLTSGTAFTTKH